MERGNGQPKEQEVAAMSSKVRRRFWGTVSESESEDEEEMRKDWLTGEDSREAYEEYLCKQFLEGTKEFCAPEGKAFPRSHKAIRVREYQLKFTRAFRQGLWKDTVSCLNSIRRLGEKETLHGDLICVKSVFIRMLMYLKHHLPGASKPMRQKTSKILSDYSQDISVLEKIFDVCSVCETKAELESLLKSLASVEDMFLSGDCRLRLNCNNPVMISTLLLWGPIFHWFYFKRYSESLSVSDPVRQCILGNFKICRGVLLFELTELSTKAPFSRLKCLDLSHNNLKALPSWLSQCLPSLQFLDLQGNDIFRICYSFRDFASRHCLRLQNNPCDISEEAFLRVQDKPIKEIVKALQPSQKRLYSLEDLCLQCLLNPFVPETLLLASKHNTVNALSRAFKLLLHQKQKCSHCSNVTSSSSISLNILAPYGDGRFCRFYIQFCGPDCCLEFIAENSELAYYRNKIFMNDKLDTLQPLYFQSQESDSSALCD